MMTAILRGAREPAGADPPDPLAPGPAAPTVVLAPGLPVTLRLLPPAIGAGAPAPSPGRFWTPPKNVPVSAGAAAGDAPAPGPPTGTAGAPADPPAGGAVRRARSASARA